MAASLMTPMASSLTGNVLGKGVMRARKGDRRAGVVYNSMDNAGKKFKF